MTFYRHVPMWFSYIHCDDLARYLEKMAAEGWKFRGFRMGLEFEKAEPEILSYDVQIFNKNTEMDMRPEPDTEEFAQYCEAAGWEFVDSQRKYVVFKRISSKAQPIYTQEEKCREAFKAEMNYFLQWFALQLFWVFAACRMVIRNPEMIFFGNNILILCYSFFTIEAAISVLRFPFIIIWRLKQKRNLKESGSADFEGNIALKFIFESRRVITLLILLLVILTGSPRLQGVWISLLGISLLCFIIAWFRPGRGGNWTIQIVGTILIFVFSSIMIRTAVSNNADDMGKDISKAPLVITDISDTGRTPSAFKYEMNSTVFGTRKSLRSSYHTPGYIDEMNEWANSGEPYSATSPEGEAPVDLDEQILNYTLYDSKSEWIIAKVTKQQSGILMKMYKENEDCSRLWGTGNAFMIRSQRMYTYDDLYNYIYFAEYPKHLLVLTYSEELSEDQVLIIRERLGI